MAKRLSKEQWTEVEDDYIANVLSNTEIAEKYGITKHSLAMRIKRHGWLREPKAKRATEVKKRLVQEAMSLGAKSCEPSENAKQIIEEAVTQDVHDMNLGLRNARRTLELAHKGMEFLDQDAEGINPVALKSYMDSTKISIETIRKIRGLDDKEPEDDIAKASYDDLIAEIESLTRAD